MTEEVGEDLATKISRLREKLKDAETDAKRVADIDSENDGYVEGKLKLCENRVADLQTRLAAKLAQRQPQPECKLFNFALHFSC